MWWVGLLAPMLERSATVLPFAVAVLLGSLVWFMLLAGVLRFSQAWLTERVRRWVLVGSGLVVLGYALYFLGQGAGMILGMLENAS